MAGFNGLGMNLGTLSRLSNAETRSISPENFTGEKGQGAHGDGRHRRSVAARDLGQGWKVYPYVIIEPGATFELADIDGSGAIQQIWMTLAGGKWRFSILRIYWDDQEQPSVEAPTGDFFASGWESFAQLSSLPVCVNPGRAFNCYWEMPFRKRARFTMTNLVRRAARRLLPDQLHADRRAGGLRLLPRAVPPHEPAALQGGLHDPRRRARAGPLRRHLHGLGRQQLRLVGRGRDQVLPRRRRRVPDDLRHRHRGLLLRRVQLRSRIARAPQSRSLALPGVHDALSPACRR